MRRAAVGEAPPLPVLSDLRALNMPQRGEVAAAYMKMFRRLRQIFEAPELAWLSRGRRTARTQMLLEQLFWAAAWLPKYDPEDYGRDPRADVRHPGGRPGGAGLGLGARCRSPWPSSRRATATR